ncbi:MAG: prolyl oligopeptidase family serine peptidase [Acidobacteriota bacterium]
MKSERGRIITFAIVAFCLAACLAQTQFAVAQQAKPKAKQGGMMGPDPRVENRTYHFKDTDEDMEYSLFVSSKVSKDMKAPLIVTLHGLGAGPTIMMTKDAVDLAEEGGYILVAPMGYNNRGWYGIPMGPRPGMGKVPPKPEGEAAKAPPKTGAKAKPKMSMFSNTNDPPNLRELSEKDVMNVLDIVRKEFNVDENRIYLMGHSMGGAGTLYLGVKYGSIWAAIAPVAPAAFGLDPNSLSEIKNVPVLFVHGAADEVVNISNTKPWIDKAKELNMTYEYNEMEGISHGPVIFASLPSVYEFFGKHSKSTSR